MTGDPVLIKPEVEKLKWKFSCIDGDLVLGDGLKCYATKLFNRRKESAGVLSELLSTALSLETRGFKVVRRKIELVIYDDRSSKIRCDGGCIDCHLDDLK